MVGESVLIPIPFTSTTTKPGASGRLVQALADVAIPQVLGRELTECGTGNVRYNLFPVRVQSLSLDC